MSVFSEGIHKQ